MTDATSFANLIRRLITTLHVTYALHAVGLAIGAFGAATVLGSFIFGWPSIIAVIINYVKRGDARGTWLESHFDWQIRTFWYAVLASILIAISGALLADRPDRVSRSGRSVSSCSASGRSTASRRGGCGFAIAGRSRRRRLSGDWRNSGPL